MRQGDCVEVHGLNSDAGKHMNGMHGIVLRVDTGTGRAIVRLGGTKKSIKVTNLRAHSVCLYVTLIYRYSAYGGLGAHCRARVPRACESVQ